MVFAYYNGQEVLGKNGVQIQENEIKGGRPPESTELSKVLVWVETFWTSPQAYRIRIRLQHNLNNLNGRLKTRFQLNARAAGVLWLFWFRP